MTISRLAIATGGTGGHIFPALAVAAEAKRRNPDCQVLFFGGSGPECILAPEAGLDFVALPAKGVMGKGAKGLLRSVWIISALWKARGHLRRFKPDAVIGFGGYAGFAPLLAAGMKKIPTAVHEQNSTPGATNRILGKLVDRVFLSFEDDMHAFPAEKCELVGNPVRNEIFNVVHTGENNDEHRLLILGGSQGAVAVNKAVIEALPQLMEMGMSIRHQAGPKNEAEVKAAYEAAGADSESVHGFIGDMAGAYAWANLALCRAGASTVFELAASGTPSVLVPFPQATHDHQTKNAKSLEAAGAAQVIAQAGITGGQIARTVGNLINNPKKLDRMTQAAKSFAMPDAAAAIVNGLEKLTA